MIGSECGGCIQNMLFGKPLLLEFFFFYAHSRASVGGLFFVCIPTGTEALPADARSPTSSFRRHPGMQI